VILFHCYPADEKARIITEEREMTDGCVAILSDGKVYQVGRDVFSRRLQMHSQLWGP
jgi:hypothetical protein